MMIPVFDYKIFKTGGDVLVAIADSSVVGKSFEEGDLKIEVSSSFYSDSKCDEKEALGIIKKATIVNAVGKDIVSLLLKEGLVESGKVITIKKVPHAQIVVLK